MPQGIEDEALHRLPLEGRGPVELSHDGDEPQGQGGHIVEVGHAQADGGVGQDLILAQMQPLHAEDHRPHVQGEDRHPGVEQGKELVPHAAAEEDKDQQQRQPIGREELGQGVGLQKAADHRRQQVPARRQPEVEPGGKARLQHKVHKGRVGQDLQGAGQQQKDLQDHSRAPR